MSPQPYVYAPYRSAHTLGRITIILLIAGAVGSGLIMIAEVFSLLLPQFQEGQELAENPGGFVALMLHALFTLLGFFIFVANGILFLMWLHRSSTNLRAFGPWNSPTHSPAWAVGSFFVPFVNLYVPYQAIKEIWLKSRPGDSQSFSFATSPPGFFQAWWGFWLASNVATNIYFRMTGGTLPRETTNIIGIVSEILSIVAAALAIQVVKEIDRRQQESINHVVPNLQMPGPPPPPTFHPHEQTNVISQSDQSGA